MIGMVSAVRNGERCFWSL